MEFTFTAIGIIHSCFKEKFAIPRQAGLAPSAKARIEMLAPYNDMNALEGLDDASHLWIQFVFHLNKTEDWKPKVKPPRLGGNKTLGVFATRSPVRPVPIGLSVVKNEGVVQEGGKIWIQLGGVDFLDGTPVLDIKPYVPYADCILAATNQFAAAPPPIMPVEISAELLAQCKEYQRVNNKGLLNGIDLAQLIRQILQQDPRPAYQAINSQRIAPERIYGTQILDLDIRWRYHMQQENIEQEKIVLTSITELL